MKAINVIFDDEEYRQLYERKKALKYRSWHDFIMGLVDKKV